MKKLIIVLCVSFFMGFVSAQTSAMYEQVDHLLWVVEDLSEVIHSWEALGFTDIEEVGEVKIHSRTDQSIAQAAIGYLNGARVIWIEPLRGSDPFRTYLRARGEGVMAMIHHADDKKTIKKEIVRLQEQGIASTEKINMTIDGHELTYHFFDTGELGRYIIGVAEKNELDPIFENKQGNNIYGLQFSQYAFATNNPEPVSEFWMNYGLPKMDITKGALTDRLYYGEPGNFKMHLGWQRHGDVVYEWCIPIAGENVYSDHINTKGEGIHHLGFNVAEMDSTLQTFEKNGFIISQAGGWGEKGQAGSGRFAYLDPHLLGGIAVELLWNYKE